MKHGKCCTLNENMELNCERSCQAYHGCILHEMSREELYSIVEREKEENSNIRMYRIDYSHRRRCYDLLGAALHNMINNQPLYDDFKKIFKDICFSINLDKWKFHIKKASVKEYENIEVNLYDTYFEASGTCIIEIEFETFNVDMVTPLFGHIAKNLFSYPHHDYDIKYSIRLV